MVNMKPRQKRRLAAEQAIYRKFNNFKECARAAQALCDKKGLDMTFCDRTVQQFVGATTNLSTKRLMVLCELLDVTNYSEIMEVFTAPEIRGAGLYWEGDNGSLVRDVENKIYKAR